MRDSPVGHNEGLLQGLLEHGDMTELGEDEAQHELVVSDHPVLAHDDRVHEGVLVQALTHPSLNGFHGVDPLQFVQISHSRVVINLKVDSVFLQEWYTFELRGHKTVTLSRPRLWCRTNSDALRRI